VTTTKDLWSLYGLLVSIVATPSAALLIIAIIAAAKALLAIAAVLAILMAALSTSMMATNPTQAAILATTLAAMKCMLLLQLARVSSIALL